MTLGPTSSSPYTEDYSKASSPLGPTSSQTYVNTFSQTRWLGPTSSDEYQVGTAGAVKLRGPQFDLQTIDLDRFSDRLLSVLAIYEGLDLTSTGSTTVYTIPAGGGALISGVLLRVSENFPVTGDAEAEININGTTKIFPAENLVNFRGKDDIYSFWKDRSASNLAAAGATVDVNVLTAALGTTLDAQVFVIGVLLL
jgi:hypothetical protein